VPEKFVEQTLQDELRALKDERKMLGKKMQDAISDPKLFARLFVKAEKLDKEIEALQASIKPEPGHGVISQATLRDAGGPEKRK